MQPSVRIRPAAGPRRAVRHAQGQVARRAFGQVPQAPVQRVLPLLQRLFVPQAFAGEHLRGIEIV
ncbi:hypothetical protein, partial [Paracidovorax cattleyae]|uniref:hypothetical protein n=1 Tax=Paracidovorax cattleyae TaxID=80868 RepID=UPI003EB885CD